MLRKKNSISKLWLATGMTTNNKCGRRLKNILKARKKNEAANIEKSETQKFHQQENQINLADNSQKNILFLIIR